MKISGIFFDLDGTLLPMVQEEFTSGYFKELAKLVCPLGVEAEVMVSALWNGVKDMVKNDGTRPNSELFWERFSAETGLPTDLVCPVCDGFYSREFNNARKFTGENPLAAEAVRAAREKAGKVALASNPIFPLVGQLTRLSWVGLREGDFDLITHYEADRWCKPNPKYYLDVCARLGLRPEDCLMIGNDETEDMHAATAAGLRAFYVTDCAIPAQTPWQGPHGSFAEAVDFIKSL